MVRVQGAGAQPMPGEYEGVSPSVKTLVSFFPAEQRESDAQPSLIDNRGTDDGS
jgi:hypothetical protein